jgi:hypothetical protein
MTEHSILSILADSGGSASFNKLRQKLSRVAYISMRYHLARLRERGVIEEIGESYLLRRRGVGVGAQARTIASAGG